MRSKSITIGEAKGILKEIKRVIRHYGVDGIELSKECLVAIHDILVSRRIIRDDQQITKFSFRKFFIELENIIRDLPSSGIIYDKCHLSGSRGVFTNSQISRKVITKSVELAVPNKQFVSIEVILNESTDYYSDDSRMII